jgi:hypothetical protein
MKLVLIKAVTPISLFCRGHFVSPSFEPGAAAYRPPDGESAYRPSDGASSNRPNRVSLRTAPLMARLRTAPLMARLRTAPTGCVYEPLP